MIDLFLSFSLIFSFCRISALSCFFLLSFSFLVNFEFLSLVSRHRMNQSGAVSVRMGRGVSCLLIPRDVGVITKPTFITSPIALAEVLWSQHLKPLQYFWLRCSHSIVVKGIPGFKVSIIET